MFNRFNVACALTPSTYWSIAVAKINLSRMDFASLITLRKQVENALSERRTTLEKQLAALGVPISSVGGKVARVARGSRLK